MDAPQISWKSNQARHILNLWDMKRFYEQYAAHEKLRQAVAELPFYWSGHIQL